MRALVLAAGIGTRLAPVTDTLPKALVPVCNIPMLQILLDKLIYWKFDEIIINTYHHTQKVIDFVKNFSQINPQVTIKTSEETELLDTGGGIKKMLNFFRTSEPVLVHNVDILTAIDLRALYDTHLQSGAAATLALQTRPTSRPLLFDERRQLVGRLDPATTNFTIVTKPTGHVSNFSFCGVQVIEPNLFLNFPGEKFYSIDVYLQATADGKAIKGVVFDNIYWKDLGTMQAIRDAEQDIKQGRFKI